ncbi:hypothetical protein CRUP_013962 [Coryphaenoides rupestris]|nr:hypothetical protein CRUP_013962 [Coryphaenoides rupestris]
MRGVQLFAVLLIGSLWAAGASRERGGSRRGQRRGKTGGGGAGGAEKRRTLHRLQQGRCRYTFILPELGGCPDPQATVEAGGMGVGVGGAQRDAPPTERRWSPEKLQHLETTMRNTTRWLQKVGDHWSSQGLEYSQDRVRTEEEEEEEEEEARHLEQKVQMLESQQRGELEVLRADKNKLQALVKSQMVAVDALEQQLMVARSNSSALQMSQAQLMESIHTLLHMVAGTTGFAVPWWRDCADIYKAGHLTSGLYDIYISNTSHPVQVYCDMETSGGGWLVFQKRFNGSVDFQRTWREYKMGFGDPLGEQWLGTEALHRLSLLGQYSLRVELQDWEGNHVYAQYDRFSLASETHGYRLVARGYSGTAGRQSSLSSHGTAFSTLDQDNDNCDTCKCALMLTGGPSYSLRSTAMMVRPYHF